MSGVGLLPEAARRIALRVAARLGEGTRVTCPICGLSLRFFFPFGVGGRIRAHALCPGCGSLERDRAAWLHISRSPQRLGAGTRLLHIAPERALEPKLRKLLGASYLTGDLARSDVDRRVSVEALPFGDASFDAIICNHVLEHVGDDRKAMAELRRVLVPGGWALLQVPLSPDLEVTDEDPSVTSPRERKRRFGQHDHVRSYGRDYVQRLVDAGFRLELIEVRTHHDPGDIERHGLDLAEVLHFCERPE